MDVQLIKFKNLPPEALSDKISRQYVYGEKAMLCRFELKKGAIIPTHQHPNEQITYITNGLVKVTIHDKEYLVHAGEVLIIPGNTPHQFEALEDTIDIDLFAPPRQDWIEGTDSYIKKTSKQ